MSDIKVDVYRVLSYEEAAEQDYCTEYSVLVGPDNFDCILREPEDCSWGRDGRDVVKKLNEQHHEIQRLTKENKQLKANVSDMNDEIRDLENDLASHWGH